MRIERGIDLRAFQNESMATASATIVSGCWMLGTAGLLVRVPENLAREAMKRSHAKALQIMRGNRAILDYLFLLSTGAPEAAAESAPDALSSHAVYQRFKSI